MWYSCAVAHTAWFEEPEWGDSIQVAEALWFERIPDWVKQDEALKLLSWLDREAIRESDWVLCTKYEADALGTPDPTWRGERPRGIQESVAESFSLLDVALWLVRPSNLGFRTVMHFGRSEDPTSLRQCFTSKPVIIRDDEIDNVLTQNDWISAGKLYIAIQSLPREKTCWVALWFLVRAVTEELWQGRYLWQWIVLEALFGPESPNETTYRLSQRIALFTASNPSEQKDMFRRLKDAYSWRSKLVHGGRTSSLTAEKSQELTTAVEAAIRTSLTRILGDQGLMEKFNGKARDSYLEDLVFSC